MYMYIKYKIHKIQKTTTGVFTRIKNILYNLYNKIDIDKTSLFCLYQYMQPLF